MCVIAYKPEGTALPKEDILQNCFDANPHGAGIAIIRPDSTEVEIHKGFMHYDDFKAFADSAVTKDDIAAYHFRITTAGGTSPQNCHPFPVSTKVQDLKALEIRSRFAMLHNGILGKGDEKASLSDTQLYIRDKLAKRGLNSLALEKDSVATETKGSRVLLMDGKTHDVAMIGEGWIKDNDYGMFFSNSSYLGWDAFGKYDNASYADEDEIPCPLCRGTATLISFNHDLFECMDCGTLIDSQGHELRIERADNDGYPFFAEKFDRYLYEEGR